MGEQSGCEWDAVAEHLSSVLGALNPSPVPEREGKRAADPRLDSLLHHQRWEGVSFYLWRPKVDQGAGTAECGRGEQYLRCLVCRGSWPQPSCSLSGERRLITRTHAHTRICWPFTICWSQHHYVKQGRRLGVLSVAV